MELAYEIRRSAARRKVTIIVERDRSVVVHAPVNVSDERLQQIVESKRLWIIEKQHHDQKYHRLPHPPGKELVSGEAAYYLGRSYRIDLVDSNTPEIQFAGRFIIPRSNVNQRRDVLKRWYVERANETIVPRTRKHAKRLGVTLGEVNIRDLRYRWGSCTPRGNINFNWRLIKAPMFVIDYVVIHELAHLIRPNHSDEFWSIVHAHTPAVKKAVLWLREFGQMLEEDI